MSNRMTAAALLLATGAFVACNDGITQTSSADIYTEPPIQENADGTWRTTLIFERVMVDRTDRKSLRVGQSGTDPLVITDIYLENLEDCDRVQAGLQPGEPFPGELDDRCVWSIDERPELPVTLEDSAFTDLQLAYKPSMPGNPTPATLVIISNAFGKTEIRVELNVVPASPVIIVSPDTLSFPGGQAGRDVLLVRNVGTGPLTVSNYRLERVNPAPIDPATMEPLTEFVIDPDRDLPWSLQPNESLQVIVEYTPQDEGNDTADLLFQSDDPSTPQLRVELTTQPLFSQLVAQPSAVVFGAPMGVGSISRMLSLRNAGRRTLFVNDMVIEQDVDAFRFEGQNSFQIGPGQSRMINLIFQPRSAEGSDATLVITSDADNLAAVGGRLLVPLLRSAAEIATLDISPLTVRLNDVAGGESRDVTVTLSNSGGLPLDVQRIAMTTDADAPLLPSDPEFEVISGGGATTIAPGDEHAVVVRFARPEGDRNEHIGFLAIDSDASDTTDVVTFTSRPVAE